MPGFWLGRLVSPEMGNFQAGGALGRMVHSASTRLNLSYALWDLGVMFRAHILCEWHSLALGGMPAWSIQLEREVRSPGRWLGWKERSENQHRGCQGGVASGLEGGAKWEEQVTEVCSGEYLRTPWHRKEQPRGEEEESQNTGFLEFVKSMVLERNAQCTYFSELHFLGLEDGPIASASDLFGGANKIGITPLPVV